MSESDPTKKVSKTEKTAPKWIGVGTFRQPFPATRWSLIEGCKDSEGADFRMSLERLCDKYWRPVYWFIRRYRGKTREEAKDLCQAFFLQFYEKEFMQSYDIEKGRFRSFVCGALQRFLNKEYRDANRQKRKPADGLVISIDAMQEEDRGLELVDERSGQEDLEQAFSAQWKKAVVRNALERMRVRVRGTEKEVSVEVFARYRIEVDEGVQPSRIEIGKELGLNLQQVRYALQWAKKEFVQSLKDELLDQVSTTEDFESEARDLFGIA